MLLIFPCGKKNNSLVKLLNFTPVASRTLREYNYVKEPLNGCFFCGGLGRLSYWSFYHSFPLSPSHPRKGLFPPPWRSLLPRTDDLLYQWEHYVYLTKRKLWVASTDLGASPSIFRKCYLTSCYGFISIAVANSLTKQNKTKQTQ